ncbi:MAG: exonuclease SbcCD subunit D C-terminal domain-containing protein [Deltaproteobacteria bacterium]|nr:exonuclease SbcCD subunit D C-terminal domain-containing protein [Deltaproteobacteria bacterium]
MRFIHTADWHLGHALAGHSRELEHQCFLDWLAGVVVDEAADALLICGDVYDQGNPPATAQRQFFSFLAEVHRRQPALQIVVIGGNHDAAARLDAPRPVLEALSVTMRGGLPRDDDGVVVPGSSVIPLRDAAGEVAVVACAVPFLRAPELSAVARGENVDVVVQGTRAIVAAVVGSARVAFPKVPLVLLAHCEVQGARMSLSSERPLFGGRHALPPSLFDDAGVVYAALGHLHLAQTLGVARYSGSPLPLSMAERDYKHQVVVVDVDAGLVSPRVRETPRIVDFLRVPGVAAPLDEVLDRLRALDLPERPLSERPFLEVKVLLDKPVPALRAQIEQALEGKPVRLVRVDREGQGDGAALGDATRAVGVEVTALSELSPTAVFQALYRRQFDGDAPVELLAALRSFVDDDDGDGEVV